MLTYPHFSVWSALIHLIITWTPFPITQFLKWGVWLCPQVTAQVWGIVHLEPLGGLGVYIPPNFDKHPWQDLRTPLGVICFAMSFIGIYTCCISSKCSPDPPTCNWLESRFSETHEFSQLPLTYRNPGLMPGLGYGPPVRITNFYILVWFWTFSLIESSTYIIHLNQEKSPSRLKNFQHELFSYLGIRHAEAISGRNKKFQ